MTLTLLFPNISWFKFLVEIRRLERKMNVLIILHYFFYECEAVETWEWWWMNS